MSACQLTGIQNTTGRFSHVKELEVLHKKTMGQSTVSYCATDTNDTTREVYSTCTPFAAKHINDSICKMKKMNVHYACEEIENGFSVRHVTQQQPNCMVNSAMDSCSCTFSSSMLMP